MRKKYERFYSNVTYTIRSRWQYFFRAHNSFNWKGFFKRLLLRDSNSFLKKKIFNFYFILFYFLLWLQGIGKIIEARNSIQSKNLVNFRRFCEKKYLMTTLYFDWSGGLSVMQWLVLGYTPKKKLSNVKKKYSICSIIYDLCMNWVVWGQGQPLKFE